MLKRNNFVEAYVRLTWEERDVIERGMSDFRIFWRTAYLSYLFS